MPDVVSPGWLRRSAPALQNARIQATFLLTLSDGFSVALHLLGGDHRSGRG